MLRGVDSGHMGVRTSFNGTVDQEVMGVGFHQSLVGDVKEYVANEMTLDISKLQPQTKDKSSLPDLDLTFTYSIIPADIPNLVTKYKGRDLVTESNGTYPLGKYVLNVVQSAAVDVISRYNALDANDNRENIKNEIKERSNEILAEENLKDKITIHQIFIKNLDISPALKDSATAVIASQNVLKAKQYEVSTAKLEAERMTALTVSGGDAYIKLLNVQANMQIANAIQDGKVNTIVVPNDFKGIVNLK